MKKFIIILILPLFLTGCINVQTDSTPAAASGGLFRTQNLGESWDRMTTLYTIGGKAQNFSASSITAIAFDSLDEKAIYVGTTADGVFYSYNYGEGWFSALRGKGSVNAIAIDPQRSCSIFVAAHNTIYKTEDCSRNWEAVYFEALPGQFITALAIDAGNSNIVYAGTSGGAFLKSQDYGYSWNVLNRFSKNSIKKIIVQSHFDNNVLYLATEKTGIYRSPDGGLSWKDLGDLKVDRASVDEDAIFLQKVKERKESLKIPEDEDLPEKEYNKLLERKYPTLKGLGKNAGIYNSLSSDRSVRDGIIYANKMGIFRLNNPETGMWYFLDLLTPESKDNIFSVIVNPLNTREIIYGTSNALYRSVDGGVNWSIRKLPTDYIARVLEFSPDNKFLYLGAYMVQKK